VNICFILYPWESINPDTDSSLRIIHEAVTRNHKVGIVYPNNLTIRRNNTYAFVKMIERSDKISSNINTFYKKTVFHEKMFPLSGFDAIFVRTNPPLDPIMLNFLDSVKDDTFIINDINGLRKASNKLYPACIDDPDNSMTPATHVSKNIDYLKKVIRESTSKWMILKPLDGYGGSGVIVPARFSRCFKLS